MNRKLKRMGFPDYIQAKLDQQGIFTPQDLFVKTPLELTQILDIFPQDLNKLFVTVAKQITPAPQTALELLQKNQAAQAYLSVFSAHTDTSIIPGAITEIVGAAGLGKTQICLQLAVQAAIPNEFGGLDSGVVFLDTESAFSASRLAEIANNRFPQAFESAEALTQLMSRVVVYNEGTAETLLNRVNSLENEIISQRIKLLIVDSVAAPVRFKFDRTQFLQRQKFLSELASMLKYLAQTFNLAVVVTNLASKFQEETKEVEGAALGLAWAHAVNTRIMLQLLGNTRTLSIVKSPVVPQQHFDYVISESGVATVNQ